MFDFERLDVYKLALEFCSEVNELLDQLPRKEFVLFDQLKRASLSIPLNIAEGSGRWQERDRRQFFLISRGSVFECVPLLTLLEKKGFLDKKNHALLRETLSRLAQMLTKMAQNLSRARDSSS